MRVLGTAQIVTLVVSFVVVFGLGRLIDVEPTIVRAPPPSTATMPTTEPPIPRDYPKNLPEMPRPAATPAESGPAESGEPEPPPKGGS